MFDKLLLWNVLTCVNLTMSIARAFDNGLRACVSVIGKCSGSQDCGKMCINIIMECSLVSEIDGVDKDSTGSEKICIVQLLYIYSTLMFIGVRKV